VLHERTIEVNSHLTRQEYTANKIARPYISTKEQVADVFTEAQIIPQF